MNTAIELIVEDETGMYDSNAYVSVAEYRNFALLNGISISDFDDNDLAVFIVRATNFVDSLEDNFVGKRLDPEQSLAFPRTKGGTCSGFYLYDMRSLKKAVFYACEAQCLGFSLLPTTLTKDDYVKKEKIEGAIEVQYSETYFKDTVFGRFPMVERFMQPYLVSNKSQYTVGR